MLTAILSTTAIVIAVKAIKDYKNKKQAIKEGYEAYCKYNEQTKCYERCCNYCNVKSECDCCCGGYCKACGGYTLRKRIEG